MEMLTDILSTPERNRYAEREADRIRRLQMTSPSHRRNRVARLPIDRDPIPQPQFINPSSIHHLLLHHPVFAICKTL